MGIFDAIFGGGVSGASEQSQQAQIAANQATEQFIREQAKLGRADIQSLFPSAQAARGAGFQGALDVISQGVPAQMEAFRGGNIAAQNITSQALPQMQSAILGTGGAVGFQPVNIAADTSFMQGLTIPEVQQAEAVAPLGDRGAIDYYNQPDNIFGGQYRGAYTGGGQSKGLFNPLQFSEKLPAFFERSPRPDAEKRDMFRMDGVMASEMTQPFPMQPQAGGFQALLSQPSSSPMVNQMVPNPVYQVPQTQVFSAPQAPAFQPTRGGLGQIAFGGRRF